MEKRKIYGLYEENGELKAVEAECQTNNTDNAVNMLRVIKGANYFSIICQQQPNEDNYVSLATKETSKMADYYLSDDFPWKDYRVDSSAGITTELVVEKIKKNLL